MELKFICIFAITKTNKDMETIDKIKVEQGDLVQAIYPAGVKVETYCPEKGIEYLENKDAKIFFRYLGPNPNTNRSHEVRLVDYNDLEHKCIYIADETNLVKIDFSLIDAYKKIEKHFGNSIYIHYYSEKDADRNLKLSRDNVQIYQVNEKGQKQIKFSIMGYICPMNWIEELIAGHEVKIEPDTNTVNSGTIGKMILIDKNSLSLYQIIRDMSRDMFEDYSLSK